MLHETIRNDNDLKMGLNFCVFPMLDLEEY